MSDFDQSETLDETEALFNLCAELRDLVAADGMSESARLAAVDHALVLALGGPVAAARQFVVDAVRGRFEGT